MRGLINVGAAIWFVLLGVVLLGPLGYARLLAYVSLISPIVYLALSAVVTVRCVRGIAAATPETLRRGRV